AAAKRVTIANRAAVVQLSERAVVREQRCGSATQVERRAGGLPGNRLRSASACSQAGSEAGTWRTCCTCSCCQSGRHRVSRYREDRLRLRAPHTVVVTNLRVVLGRQRRRNGLPQLISQGDQSRASTRCKTGSETGAEVRVVRTLSGTRTCGKARGKAGTGNLRGTRARGQGRCKSRPGELRCARARGKSCRPAAADSL